MTNDEKENCIDKLLVWMNNEIEQEGSPINCAHFDFSEDNPEDIAILGDFEKLAITIRTCVTRNYLKHIFIGSGDFGGLCLTEEGQGRAISVLNQKPAQTETPPITIGTFNNNGNAQVGNYNTQSITNTFNYLLEQVEKLDAPEHSKKDLKNKLNDIISHPLFNTILSVGAGIGAALL